MRRRRDRSSEYRRRRAAVILLTGGVAWALLYMTGYAGTWQTALLCGLVGLVLIVNTFSGSQHSTASRHGTTQLPDEDAPAFDAPPAAPPAGRRPNAIADDYNNLTGRWPTSQPQPAKAARKQPEVRTSRPALLEVEAERVSRMPPPVPPPLYGRPGSRPIVAGMEGTVGRARVKAEDEVAATVLSPADSPSADSTTVGSPTTDLPPAVESTSAVRRSAVPRSAVPRSALPTVAVTTITVPSAPKPFAAPTSVASSSAGPTVAAPLGEVPTITGPTTDVATPDAPMPVSPTEEVRATVQPSLQAPVTAQPSLEAPANIPHTDEQPDHLDSPIIPGLPRPATADKPSGVDPFPERSRSSRAPSLPETAVLPSLVIPDEPAALAEPAQPQADVASPGAPAQSVSLYPERPVSARGSSLPEPAFNRPVAKSPSAGSPAVPAPLVTPSPSPAPSAPTPAALSPGPTPSAGLRAAAATTAPATPAPSVPAPATPPRAYHRPSFELLPMPASERGLSDDEILERASLLERTLASFGVEAKVVDFAFGPAVTRYELQPGPGVRVNKFTALADDLALAMAAVDVRVEAPIPGKSAVGIEVPNKERLAVPLREVLQSPKFQQNPSKLAVAFGKDNSGHPVVGDLARMPHLLIAGSTGSGKSVCMNSIICSLLFKARPDEVKMLMIDPKMVELSIYNGIPHLTAPVITDVKKAAGYLKGAVKEMEGRYELFAAMGVRNIEHHNQLVRENPGPDPAHPRRPLPYIVIFIDELADLMMVAPADVEDSICRLAQMARACGMHLVIATQSPRVDVITGLIKANVPSRIAFAVSSQVDSRVILDSAGAERLLGRGDMLYHPSGLSKPLRAQGAFIEESSVEELVRFVKAQGEPEFTAQEVAIENGSRRGSKGGAEESHPTSAVDEALPEAARIIIEHGQASVSILQRRLRCNYTKASRLIDMLEDLGLIGPHQGSKPREVLASMARWQELFGPGGLHAVDADDPEED